LRVGPLQPPNPAIRRGGAEWIASPRETLRNMVERESPPERPDRRRHWRWAGPLIGYAYYWHQKHQKLHFAGHNTNRCGLGPL
jgi:hypothetical protein